MLAQIEAEARQRAARLSDVEIADAMVDSVRSGAKGTGRLRDDPEARARYRQAMVSVAGLAILFAGNDDAAITRNTLRVRTSATSYRDSALGADSYKYLTFEQVDQLGNSLRADCPTDEVRDFALDYAGYLAAAVAALDDDFGADATAS